MDRSVLKIYIISLIDLLAVGLIFPLLFPHIRTLGASHLVVGVFGATYSGLQVLSGPVIGSWSDLRGRSSVASVVLSISAICYVLTAFTTSVAVIYILRILLGSFKHTQTLCKALIADIVPKDKQTEVYGRSTAVSSIGFIVGPIVGGHLIELPNGFSYVCILTAILFVINIVLFRTFEDVIEGKVSEKEQFHLTDIRQEFTKAVRELFEMDWKEYWDVFILRFLYSFCITIYFSNQSLFISEQYQLSQKYIGYIISFFSLIGGLSSIAIGHIKVKFYNKHNESLTLLLHLFLTMTLCFFGIHLSPNLGFLLLLIMPFAFSSAALRVLTMELILNRSHTNDKGSLAGVANSVMSIGRFISPLISGIIADWCGESKVMLFAFVPSLLATFLCVKLIKTKSKAS